MRRLVFGTMLCLSISGCPVPEVTAPDFTPAGSFDFAQAPADAGARDMGPQSDMPAASQWRNDAPAGTSATLRGIAQSATDSYVVGDGGTILHRTSDTWRSETAPLVNGAAVDLYGVAVLSNNDAVAVGGGGAVLRRSFGTNQWTVEMNTGATATLYAVTQLASGDIIAVGDKGVVVAYSNNAWKTESVPMALTSLSLRGVGAKGSDAYAVGSYAGGAGTTGVILHRGAGTWTQDTTVAAADQVPLYAVAVANNTVYVAGAKAKVLRQDAGGWVAESTVVPAAGDGGVAPAATDFLALTGTSDGTLVAAGTGGGLQVRQGGTWTSDTVTGASDLYGVAGTWPRSLYAVGKGGFLGRRF